MPTSPEIAAPAVPVLRVIGLTTVPLAANAVFPSGVTTTCSAPASLIGVSSTPVAAAIGWIPEYVPTSTRLGTASGLTAAIPPGTDSAAPIRVAATAAVRTAPRICCSLGRCTTLEE